MENRLYANGFGHDYTESTDASSDDPAANGVTFYSTNGKKPTTYRNVVPGKYADAKSHDYGDTLTFKAHTSQCDILLGAWADLALGWHFRKLGGHMRDVTPSLNILNLFNNRAVSDFAGNQSAASAGYPDGAPLYWRLAGRSVFFNLTAILP